MAIGRFWIILLLCLLGTWCQADTEREYAVTILTDPPNDPYQAGSGNVQFTCLVDPLPPEPITYQWKILASPYGSQRSGQNMTFNPYYDNLRFSWFFCHVFSNSTLVSIGYQMVEIHGIFSSTQQPVHHFLTGDDLTLRVSEIFRYYSRYVSSVTWYHNGSEVSSGERFLISNNLYEKELNITDLSSSDAGMYQTKVRSLSIYGSQYPACDSLLIPLLENHAALAPVTFMVRESSECKIEDYNSSSLHPPISTYYFVDQDGEEFIIEETIHLPVQLDLSTLSHYHQLFHNGESISSSGTKYNTSISVSEGSVIKVVLVIRNITEDDSGLYTTPVLTAIHELLFTDSLGCRNAHDYFHFFVFDLSLSQISMGMVTFSVEKYRPPVILFSLSHQTPKESSVHCTVNGGKPSSYLHNIMLIKNESTVIQAQGDHLSYNISLDMFGVYTCIVESLHSTDNKTLLIPEKATFQILVDVNMKSQCEPSLLESQHVDSVLTSIMAVIEDQCNCSISMDNFEGSRLTCLGYGSNAIFTSTLVYADSEGKVLASNLVGMLQSQIEATDGQALEGTSFVFPTSCQSSTNGGIIAGGFIGGWIVGLLTFALAIGIGVCILKIRNSVLIRKGRDSTQRQDAYATSEEMKMASVEVNPNAAYETVSTRHQNRCSGRHQQTVIDEPVYDIPEP